MSFTFVDSEEKLDKLCQDLQHEHEIAVDFEAENNLHHYGAYLALIQISTKDKNYIVDVLKLEKIDSLLAIFRNEKILKIFHDVSFDFRIINNEFKCIPKNVFDTQVAAQLLGKVDLGLGSLLEKYFGVKKQRKFQMADWTKRPIRKDMLEYAMNDTVYLIKLKEILRKELVEKGRVEWFKEECAEIEKAKWEYSEQQFNDVKGYSLLTPKQRGVLKRLFALRAKLGKKVDRPVHFIFSTKRMMEFVKHPLSYQGWKTLRGVHPIVRARSREFQDAVEKGKEEPIELPKREVKRMSPKQKNQLDDLKKRREFLAEKYNLAKHLVMSNEQMKEIVISGSFNGLKKWQREIVEM